MVLAIEPIDAMNESFASSVNPLRTPKFLVWLTMKNPENTAPIAIRYKNMD
jgi:hypothetical protein